MPDTGDQTISGEGEFLLPAAVAITWITYYLDTVTAEVDFRSTTHPARVMHAGWIGLASGLTGVAGAGLSFADLQMLWWSYFEFESFTQDHPSGSFPYVDRVIWHLPTGVVAHFTAFW